MRNVIEKTIAFIIVAILVALIVPAHRAPAFNQEVFQRCIWDNNAKVLHDKYEEQAATEACEKEAS